MVKSVAVFLGACVLTAALSAEIQISSSSVDLSSAQIQQAIGKLDAGLDKVFFALASQAGPGIVNAAAFSSTIGIQRQDAELPKLQIEPSVGILLPQKQTGDERLTSLPLYAISVVGGARIDERNAIQARAFYLPEISFKASGTQFAVQPFNFGITYTRQVKKNGDRWYSPAIITPLDLAYMHGRLSASFTKRIDNLEFDPDGDGSEGNSARATLDFRDDLTLKWDVYSFTTGIILVKPFFYIFSARLGFLSSLHAGVANLSNTATGTMAVTASAVTGTNVFEVNDTASVTFRNSATFRPIMVSNQITMGLGIAIGAATLNFDIAQNVQVNATALTVQLGCWF